MKLKDRVALVTGGGSGLGRAISLLFAEEGAHVIVNELSLETAEQTVSSMKGPAGRRAIQADVADSAQVKAMFATVEREVGGLDILVNNAGIAFGPGDDRAEVGRKSEALVMELLSGQGGQTHLDITQNLSDESWRRMLAVHVDGTFFCTREALRLMSRKNRGAIVNLSSVAALTGLEVVPHYSAAKGAILAFTRAVARDVASRGIRVNAICPGYIDTPMTERMSPLIRAAVLATMASQRLESLVLIDPVGIRVDGWIYPFLFGMDIPEIVTTIFQNPKAALALAPPDQSVDTLALQYRQGTALARVSWNPYLYNPLLRRRLGRIGAPTLLCWGAHDRLAPLAPCGETWAREILGARLRVFAESGHVPHLEEPDAVAEAIGEFCRLREGIG